MSRFDSVAGEFERHRALPDGVAEEIREMVWAQIGSPNRIVLDLGAGTGRLGRAFVNAGDRYVGVDRSGEMLERFKHDSKQATRSFPSLIQADGSRLPFRDDAFGIVFIAHVLSASGDAQHLLAEACRVLDAEGVLILGQRVGPANGIDAQLREQLRNILAEMDVEMPAPGKAKNDARAWLTGVAKSQEHMMAASWMSDNEPREFFTRHGTGARFSALDAEVKQNSFRALSEWATGKFGSLDATVIEEYKFELDVFRFQRD